MAPSRGPTNNDERVAGSSPVNSTTILSTSVRRPQNIPAIQESSALNQASSLNRLRPIPSRESSVRIRRLSSSRPISQQGYMPDVSNYNARRRSSSEPRRPQATLDAPAIELTKQRTAATLMPPVAEETASGGLHTSTPSTPDQRSEAGVGDPPLTRTRTKPQELVRAARSVLDRRRNSRAPGAFSPGREYGSNAVDLLDVIGVSANESITNLADSCW